MFDTILKIILKIKKVDIFIVNILRWFIFIDSIFENIHSMYHIN